MSCADEKPCVRSKLSQEKYKSDIDTMIASPDLSGGDVKSEEKRNRVWENKRQGHLSFLYRKQKTWRKQERERSPCQVERKTVDGKKNRKIQMVKDQRLLKLKLKTQQAHAIHLCNALEICLN